MYPSMCSFSRLIDSRGGINLPINFEHVKLGKKEVMAVRQVYPDYEPED
jgi:hypothetical protein